MTEMQIPNSDFRLFLFFVPCAAVESVDAGVIWTVSDGNRLTPVKPSCGVLYSPFGKECGSPK